MWFIQPKHDYTQEMPWDYNDEPAQLIWQIKARPYRVRMANTVLAGCCFAAFLFGLLYNTQLEESSTFPRWVFPLGAAALMWSIAIWMTHQTAIIVYRVTEHHVEFFSWKPQIDTVAPLMKWTAAILAIPVAIIILLDPGTVLAAAGPLGLALTGYMMGTSKRNQAIYRDEVHQSFPVEDINEIVTLSKRRVVNLKYRAPPRVYKPVFCTKENYDDVLAFFKKKTALNSLEKPVIIGNTKESYIKREDHPDSPDLRPPKRKPKR